MNVCKNSTVVTLQKLMWIVMLMVGYTQAMSDVDSDYPLRHKYPSLDIISTETFKGLYQNEEILVVDVRTPFEYRALHVTGALNINVDEKSFQSTLQSLREENPNKKIILYCNGRTCSKSYKAGVKCKKLALDCLVYDSGIMDWVKAMPESSKLYDVSPVKEDDLISDEEFQSRLLNSEEFIEKVINTDVVVLDIRTGMERISALFPMKGVSTAPLESRRFERKVQEAKKSKKPLLIFDASGTQIRWCMYYLKNQGIEDYYFAQGGVLALSAVMDQQGGVPQRQAQR